MVVGAYALALHGIPRATGDIDIWLESREENAERVWRALQRFGAPTAALGVSREDLVKPGLVIQLGLPPRRIDLLTEISGVGFSEAWENRVTQTVDGLPLPFLDREALLRNKRASGRKKDLADVEALERGETP
ncbi:hypothetical protein [Truepera radiovictrix]|uniref:hypothetical protein n=1 Tax=Truepera radiovictrix TaxID=332249 RepID=UPI001C86EF70|nr:hypothetical protein [Truepera radiovictrix]